MEVKFIKYLITTKQLFLSVDGESVSLIIDHSYGVPYVKPDQGSLEGIDAAINYLKEKVDPSIDMPAASGTIYVPLGIGMLIRLLGLGGKMNKARWEGLINFTVTAPRTYRAPSPAVSFSHFVYKGTLIESDAHYVIITSSDTFLLLSETGNVYSRIGIDVPANAEILTQIKAADAYLNHIRDGRKGITDMVSGEAINISVDMKTGVVDFLSGGSRSQNCRFAADARIVAEELCRFFELNVPVGLTTDVTVNEEKVVTIDRLFELGDSVRDWLPGEVIKCEEAMKYGDYYYLMHGYVLDKGEQSGILVRLETIEHGACKNGTVYSGASPVAIMFDRYAITRSVDPRIVVTDFTGMAQSEFNKYINKLCR